MSESASGSCRGALPQPAKRWTGRTRGGFLGNWVFVILVRYCGLRWAYALLLPVALYFVVAAPKASRASVQYRKRVGCPGASWLGRLWGTYQHFLCFGELLLDRLAVLRGDASRFAFNREGDEHFQSALDEGKGLIVVSAHCGNWAVAAQVMARFGKPLSIVAYEGEAARIRSLFERSARQRNFSVIQADGSADCSLAIISALGRGEIVAMHADRCIGDDRAQSATFFGAPAHFAPGPFIAAAISGAPLIHCFAMREKRFQYRLRAYPVEHLRFEGRQSRNEQIAQWVEQFVRRLERELRAHPFQWQNFYDFWETR